MSVLKKRRITGKKKEDSPNNQMEQNFTRMHWASNNTYLIDNQRLKKELQELQNRLESVNEQWRIHTKNIFKQKENEINKLKQVIDTFVIRHPEAKNEFYELINNDT